jgi:DNA-binding transcriptional ArsR family regulator
MAFSKTRLFDPADQMTSAFAKVLTHPVRLDMLRKLSTEKSCTVENLAREYPLAKATISQHLEILRKADLIGYKEQHPYILYFLNKKTLHKLLPTLINYCLNLKDDNSKE